MDNALSSLGALHDCNASVARAHNGTLAGKPNAGV